MRGCFFALQWKSDKEKDKMGPSPSWPVDPGDPNQTLYGYTLYICFLSALYMHKALETVKQMNLTVTDINRWYYSKDSKKKLMHFQ